MSKASVFLQLHEEEEPMETYYHVTTKRNSKKVFVDGLSPRKGARSKEFGELESAVYLFTSIEDAEDAVVNWLGDEFPESAALVLLQIRVPEGFGIVKEEGQFEARSLVPIPGKYIKLVKEL
jgi:hypothetical protein